MAIIISFICESCHNRYTCPIYFKSVVDLSRFWRKFDEEVRTHIYFENMFHFWIACKRMRLSANEFVGLI
ncbi:hypothetical protein KSP40_PGU020493 [Platanthera guangdongensis]|uniref:Uncharacterized protein n=1 Tax=Platanthera guangdongensis TaxID=2320717 RepID=A0ABR2M3A7_9ASPA